MTFVRRLAGFALPVMLILAATVTSFSGAAPLATGPAVAAQGPTGAAFTYQGQLNSGGAPVNASCDFQFSLWDDAAAGAQVGVTLAPTLNVVDGLFTATLDFGDQFTGDARWLEIALQCPGDPGVTVLSPRAALLGVPYANGLRPGVAVADSSDGSSASIAIPGYGLAGSNATGTGVHGSSASGAGVRGSSTAGPGVSGVSANDTGVLGEAQTFLQAGVKGTNSADNGIGVRGEANATGGVGLWGQSTSGTGVFGVSTSGSGIHGSSAHSSGVYGTSGTTQQAGVKGINEASSGIGVRGEANSSGGVGVWGQSTANTGVYGLSTDGIGVWGQSTTGLAMRADGNAVQASDKGGWMSRLAAMMGLYFWLQLSLCILAAVLFLTNIATQRPADRQPARGVALGAVIALIFGALLSVVPIALEAAGWLPTDSVQAMTLRQELTWVVALVVPVSFAAAILRYRLFDIDLVLNRTLVYGMLSAITIGIYAALVSILSALLPTGNDQLALFLGTGVVAVLFQPLRERVQRGVNRLMYGKRDDPYAVLSHLGQQLGGTLAPDAVAPSIVQTMGQILKLPYVALNLAIAGAAGDEVHMEPAATWGTWPAYPLVDFPLVYQQQSVGLLQVAPRAAGERFSASERQLLNDLAAQVGVAVAALQQTRQAQHLAADLQHARARLVVAREEERRRLRRDLHDGLGPALASLTLKTDAAHDELAYDVPAAATMLVDLKSDIQAAVADIRRLVYDLRPPALDDLGLVTSLRMQASHYAGPSLAITVDAPDSVPALPAAVEVALYRIAGEALTNVVRHANAHTCLVRLAMGGDRVELEIVDDGRGLPVPIVSGVGLVSMRERAAELGGTCTLTSVPGQGTCVHVRLPQHVSS